MALKLQAKDTETLISIHNQVLIRVCHGVLCGRRRVTHVGALTLV